MLNFGSCPLAKGHASPISGLYASCFLSTFPRQVDTITIEEIDRLARTPQLELPSHENGAVCLAATADIAAVCVFFFCFCQPASICVPTFKSIMVPSTSSPLRIAPPGTLGPLRRYQLSVGFEPGPGGGADLGGAGPPAGIHEEEGRCPGVWRRSHHAARGTSCVRGINTRRTLGIPASLLHFGFFCPVHLVIRALLKKN